MNSFEVRIANKRTTILGCIGAILLCGTLYCLGTEMKYTTQQTYIIIAGLSLYTLIMYRVNVKKSKVVNFYFNADTDLVVVGNENTLEDIYVINKYYYRNILPKRLGFLLHIKTDKGNCIFYIVSKDLASYTTIDSNNVDQLSKYIDKVLKGKKSRNLIVDCIAYLPLLLVLISIITIGCVLYIINI
ncbi:hypothetical protein [Chryseobacterium sp. Mn2064]|uniref:hypothetical protein n=1 Tax=Chryseobacterium sp. Mn2064 TaxID=3395263 RepID=UPI003BDFDD1F